MGRANATRLAAVVALLAVLATIATVWWISARPHTPASRPAQNAATNQEMLLPMQVPASPEGVTPVTSWPPQASTASAPHTDPSDPSAPSSRSQATSTGSPSLRANAQSTTPRITPTATSSSSAPRTPAPTRKPVLTQAQQLLGKPRSGLPWHSGVLFDTNKANVLALNEFGQWRTRKLDIVTSNPQVVKLEEMGDFASRYSGPILQGFPGRMVLQLPMFSNEVIPPEKQDVETNLKYKEISAGKYDSMWKSIAKNLIANGRGDALINMGTNVGTQGKSMGEEPSEATDFIAAYRHIVSIFRKQSSDMKFVFSTNCSRANRSEMLQYFPAPYTLHKFEEFYPGDDVVDIVGCSLMDLSFESGATTNDEWKQVMNPSDPYAVGLQQVVDLARKKGKGFAVTTWYLMPPTVMGNGDNPFLVQKMYDFFKANQDILVYESLGQTGGEQVLDDGQTVEGTNDPTMLIKGQMPKAAELYRKLWGK